MATTKVGQIFLGPGDLNSTAHSTIFMGTSAPTPAEGVDGDLFILKAGLNSNLFIKRNSVWVGFIDVPLTVSIPDNTTNHVWFSIAAAAARYIHLEIGVERGSKTRISQLMCLNDLSSAAVTEYGIITLGGATGITFDAQIVGTTLNLVATTDNQLTSANVKFFIKYWS